MATEPAPAELEVGLHRRDADSYTVELRFSQPGSDADVRLVCSGPPLARFDMPALRQLMLDDTAYGRLLTDALFVDPCARSTFAQARTTADTLGVPLKIRLFIGATAPELHDLRWETLRDPEQDVPLLTGERVRFSRYLSSLDWRPVRLRPRSALRALLVIANPSDVAEYTIGTARLSTLDVEDEVGRARKAMDGIETTVLASGGAATLNNLIDRLSEGYDVLYLVCHGALIGSEPWLWLEDAAGRTGRIAGSQLAARMSELRQMPRLVVLASCQSAGCGDNARSGDAGALSALGPRLAEVGVPAVVAMQGDVLVQTISAFMPAFFRELIRNGHVDLAMSVARRVVLHQPDWWAPALFTRLKSGCIWYTPGFGDDTRSFEKWPALLRRIEEGKCTPILGSGLLEFLLGSTREIARGWAETYGFPMAAAHREDLPQVAQYLAVNQEPDFPLAELRDHMRRRMLQLYGSGPAAGLEQAPLDDLIKAVGNLYRVQKAAEPHKLLASLPFAVYITTNPDILLEDALRAAGKQPCTVLCPWNDAVEASKKYEYAMEPSVQKPLVYHLFGCFSEPDSLVLTEDSYFDYLIGVTENRELIPEVVRVALSDRALLFLGFQIDDWNFRVLFRSVMQQEGGGRRRRYAHVAVQVNPEEGHTQVPERARRYLESYLGDADISIYWGSVEDFAQELQERAQAAGRQAGQLAGGQR